MKRTISGKALYGHHLAAISLDSKHGTSLNTLAVQVNHAGPALAGITADVGASKIELLAQVVNE